MTMNTTNFVFNIFSNFVCNRCEKMRNAEMRVKPRQQDKCSVF